MHAARSYCVNRSSVSRWQSSLGICRLVSSVWRAFGTAHYWGRRLQSYGHTVKLMASRFVKPYLTGEKNDANDAAAICEAVGRPSIRFLPLKSAEQQALLVLHRTCAGLVRARTGASNQARGLLLEFGLVLRVGRRVGAAGLVPIAMQQAQVRARTAFEGVAGERTCGDPTLRGAKLISNGMVVPVLKTASMCHSGSVGNHSIRRRRP